MCIIKYIIIFQILQTNHLKSHKTVKLLVKTFYNLKEIIHKKL